MAFGALAGVTAATTGASLATNLIGGFMSLITNAIAAKSAQGMGGGSAASINPSNNLGNTP